MYPIYFLTMRKKGKNRFNLTAIKDEHTGERFACAFVSATGAEEFMVANDLTFGYWHISGAKSPVFVQSRCNQAPCDSVHEAVINPPPLTWGKWRTLPVEYLVTWSYTAKEPLLVWAEHKIRLKQQGGQQESERIRTRPSNGSIARSTDLIYPPRVSRPLARKCTGAYEQVGDEAHTKFLQSVQVEIKTTAWRRLAEWVAKQNDR